MLGDQLSYAVVLAPRECDHHERSKRHPDLERRYLRLDRLDLGYGLVPLAQRAKDATEHQPGPSRWT
jgi:hypothetical protein